MNKVVSFLTDEILWSYMVVRVLTNLYREKVSLGSQFWKFQSMVC
jgi:hypothetical protein